MDKVRIEKIENFYYGLPGQEVPGSNRYRTSGSGDERRRQEQSTRRRSTSGPRAPQQPPRDRSQHASRHNLDSQPGHDRPHPSSYVRPYDDRYDSDDDDYAGRDEESSDDPYVSAPEGSRGRRGDAVLGASTPSPERPSRRRQPSSRPQPPPSRFPPSSVAPQPHPHPSSQLRYPPTAPNHSTIAARGHRDERDGGGRDMGGPPEPLRANRERAPSRRGSWRGGGSLSAAMPKPRSPAQRSGLPSRRQSPPPASHSRSFAAAPAPGPHLPHDPLAARARRDLHPGDAPTRRARATNTDSGPYGEDNGRPNCPVVVVPFPPSPRRKLEGERAGGERGGRTSRATESPVRKPHRAGSGREPLSEGYTKAAAGDPRSSANPQPNAHPQLPSSRQQAPPPVPYHSRPTSSIVIPPQQQRPAAAPEYHDRPPLAAAVPRSRIPIATSRANANGADTGLARGERGDGDNARGTNAREEPAIRHASTGRQGRKREERRLDATDANLRNPQFPSSSRRHHHFSSLVVTPQHQEREQERERRRRRSLAAVAPAPHDRLPPVAASAAIRTSIDLPRRREVRTAATNAESFAPRLRPRPPRGDAVYGRDDRERPTRWSSGLLDQPVRRGGGGGQRGYDDDERPACTSSGGGNGGQGQRDGEGKRPKKKKENIKWYWFLGVRLADDYVKGRRIR